MIFSARDERQPNKEKTFLRNSCFKFNCILNARQPSKNRISFAETASIRVFSIIEQQYFSRNGENFLIDVSWGCLKTLIV